MGILSPETLADGLRAALRHAGLTVEELARRSGLAVSTVHNYLRTRGQDRRVPGSLELRRMAHVLAQEMGVEADELWKELGQLLDNTQGRERVRGPSPPMVMTALLSIGLVVGLAALLRADMLRPDGPGLPDGPPQQPVDHPASSLTDPAHDLEVRQRDVPDVESDGLGSQEPQGVGERASVAPPSPSASGAGDQDRDVPAEGVLGGVLDEVTRTATDVADHALPPSEVVEDVEDALPSSPPGTGLPVPGR